jgi:hypothetical protein
MRTVVPLDDAKHLGQSQTSASTALRREIRLEDAGQYLGRHAHARVRHFDHHVTVFSARAQADPTATWQSIHRVEQHIGQRLPQTRCPANDGRIALRLHVQANRPALNLSCVAPAGRGQLHDFSQQAFNIQLLRHALRLAAAERQQSLDGLAAFERGLSHRVQRFASEAEIRLRLIERLASHCAIAGDQQQRLVEGVGDAAGHLAERTQLLRLGQRLALLFAYLALGNIDVCAQHAHRAAGRIAEYTAFTRDPAVAPVRAADAMLQAQLAGRGDGFGHCRFDERQVFRVGLRQERTSACLVEQVPVPCRHVGRLDRES